MEPRPIEVSSLSGRRDSFIENFKATLRQATDTSSLKLKTYNLIRTYDFVLQPYLRAKNRDLRKRMARFRTGSHWLAIHQGRFTGVERENRICKKCSLGVVEDEEHMMFVCPLYATAETCRTVCW